MFPCLHSPRSPRKTRHPPSRKVFPSVPASFHSSLQIDIIASTPSQAFGTSLLLSTSSHSPIRKPSLDAWRLFSRIYSATQPLDRDIYPRTRHLSSLRPPSLGTGSGRLHLRAFGSYRSFQFPVFDFYHAFRQQHIPVQRQI